MKLQLLTFALFIPLLTLAQPISKHASVSIEKLISVGNDGVRIDHDPNTGELYYATIGGTVWKVNLETKKAEIKFRSSDHGLSGVFGFEIGKSGNFYLVSMDEVSGNNVATIKRYTNEQWVTMATATYPASDLRDHKFNAIIESPDQQYVLVNSGSRTDHGEKSGDGTRDMPITTKIIKLPIDAENIVLENDLDFLTSNGYIFADGVRNHFDLEYAPNGDLFGVENSGARDDEEELNWLQEGHHYGFPWIIGTFENPMRFADFDPPGSDHLIVDGINMERTFYNDPDYPAPPAGVEFTEPVRNYGPDADHYRDTTDGQIKNASELGLAIGSFTPHSSPLALTFDTDSLLGEEFTGKGFAMSYNDASLTKYKPFNDPGEDLLLLDLTKTGDNYTMNVHRIAQNFNGPVDATLIGNKMYVLETGNGSSIWELTFPDNGEPALSTIGIRTNQFKVYPNTFREAIQIDKPNALKGEAQVSIHSLSGKTLLSKSWNLAQNSSLKLEGVGISGLSKGIYLIQISHPKLSQTVKIIKN